MWLIWSVVDIGDLKLESVRIAELILVFWVVFGYQESLRKAEDFFFFLIHPFKIFIFFIWLLKKIIVNVAFLFITINFFINLLDTCVPTMNTVCHVDFFC